MSHVYNLLNRYDNNLYFTVDLFQNETPHFLSREILPDSRYFFRKGTQDCTLILSFMSLELEVWYLVHFLSFFFVKQIIDRNQT